MEHGKVGMSEKANCEAYGLISAVLVCLLSGSVRATGDYSGSTAPCVVVSIYGGVNSMPGIEQQNSNEVSF